MGCSRFFHSVRYLKPVQIYGRAWFRFYKPKADSSPSPSLNTFSGDWQPPLWKVISLVGTSTFRFLNEEHQITTARDWNNPQWGKLWLYNLHYFDDLNATGAEERKDQHLKLIEKWIVENPPGQGNGWESYPTSLRIINWIKWALAGNCLSANARQSLAVQIRYLRKRLEYHLQGNHLFANAKALVFAGNFFTGQEAQNWLVKGLEILVGQIPEQVLEDGGHFELSPMYHSIVLEDLLDLVNLLRTYGRSIPFGWNLTVRRMLAWLANMRHPDGEITFFNDSAFNIAAKPDKLFDYAKRLGFEPLGLEHEGGEWLKSSGYVRWQGGAAVAILDIANIGPDYLPGHAHADTLSFELSLWEQRVLVNSGTSCYGDCGERHRQRGTSAHNTVEINGEDSSEVWSGFRVARRALPEALTVNEEGGRLRVACSHNGYRRLPGTPVHHREWEFDQGTLQITDTILGSCKKAVSRFYLHPDIRVMREENACSGQLVLPKGQAVSWKISGGICNIVGTTWHPEFGLSVQNQCIEVAFATNETRAIFSWL
jgi:uncharacterized heparinase superfamily protein